MKTIEINFMARGHTTHDIQRGVSLGLHWLDIKRELDYLSKNQIILFKEIFVREDRVLRLPA